MDKVVFVWTLDSLGWSEIKRTHCPDSRSSETSTGMGGEAPDKIGAS